MRTSARLHRLTFTERLAAAFSIVVAMAMMTTAAAPPAQAAMRQMNGGGSSYVGLAMKQWTSEAQTRGIPVNYTPDSSPSGIDMFGRDQIGFPGTEAEVSGLTNPIDRSYQYIPDVAGAVSVMYNVQEASGKPVDYLHLSQRTVARIFMGDIRSWADPAISADNQGIAFPDQPIRVVYRSGLSGTTALFYDFVQHAAPDIWAQWQPTYAPRAVDGVRVISLESGFASNPVGQTSSDAIANYIANPSGLWSIGYDEFGYAKVYGNQVAWVQNAAGAWTQPYAANISAALETATLRPDLSQELSAVYTNPNPLTYPISAYSYIMTPCPPAGDRATCTNNNLYDADELETMEAFLEYIACDGQIPMSQIGYSPLPTNLSQEIINAIGRMKGQPPSKVLTPENCSNPRFHNSLGPGDSGPKDPFEGLPPGGGGGGGGGGEDAGGGGDPNADQAQTGATDPNAANSTAAQTSAAQGPVGNQEGAEPTNANGGAGDGIEADPVAYAGDTPGGAGPLPMLAVVAVIAAPVLLIGGNRLMRRLRRRRVD